MEEKYAEQHLTCTDMLFWSFFQIFYLNKKKRSRIAVFPTFTYYTEKTVLSNQQKYLVSI